MKIYSKLFALVFFCLLTVFAHAAKAESREEIYKEIRETIGFVPEFFDPIPEKSIAIFWRHFVDSFLSPGVVLSSKDKELVGVAAAGIKNCEYCTVMHRRLAVFHGATKEEVEDAAQVATAVGAWSTHLYTIDYGVDKFTADVDRIICFLGPNTHCTE